MTDFSYSDLSLTIDGVVYTADKLAGITISKSIDGIGTSGVSTTCLSGRVRTKLKFSPNAKITVKYRDWEFPYYYIDSSDFDGVSVSFTAYDLCKDLDLPFDITNYKFLNGKNLECEYDTSLVISDIANQIGFAGCSNISRISTLKYSDLKGSCREVLQKLSEADCCVYYCGNDNHLKAVALGGSSSAASITGCSPVVEKSQKSITAIVIEDTRHNNTYAYGTGNFTNTLFLSGDLISETVSQAIASQILNSGTGQYDYLSFRIDTAVISSNLEICGQVFIGDKIYNSSNITITFGAVNAAAELSSNQINETKIGYAQKISRLLGQRVKLGTSYGCYFVNKNGSGVAIKL